MISTEAFKEKNSRTENDTSTKTYYHLEEKLSAEVKKRRKEFR